MRRIAILAACMLAGPAAAAPFSSFSMPATCRITKIDDDGPHRVALWKGTADGTPSLYVEYGDEGYYRYAWSAPRPTADGSVYDVRVTTSWNGVVEHSMEEQTVDASGHIVGDTLTYSTWTYDGDDLIGFVDGDAAYQWKRDELGRLWSMTYDEGWGDNSWYWAWTDDGFPKSFEAASSWGSSYGHDWETWNDMGLPTSGAAWSHSGSGGWSSESETVEWDDRGRVTRWETPDATRTYTWTDAASGAVRVETSNDGNYAWDDRGRLVRSSGGGGGSWRYSWDAEGTLRAARFSSPHSRFEYTFAGVCPEAAWASYVNEVPTFGPLHDVPTPPRPFGW